VVAPSSSSNSSSVVVVDPSSAADSSSIMSVFAFAVKKSSFSDTIYLRYIIYLSSINISLRTVVYIQIKGIFILLMVNVAIIMLLLTIGGRFFLFYTTIIHINNVKGNDHASLGNQS
jgi:hypothetical protein